MINGHMAEAQKGFAVIEDFDEDTFARFIQWAYNGYYSAAEYELDIESHSLSDNESNDRKGAVPKLPLNGTAESPSEPVVEVVQVEPFAEQEPAIEEPAAESCEEPPAPEWEWFSGSKRSSNKGKRAVSDIQEAYAHRSTTDFSKRDLKEAFVSRKETVRKTSISLPQPRRNQKRNENYTEVFLSHARLYVFAEKYDIQPLKTLALEELQAVLGIFDLYTERTGDIIALIRYVYANTGEPVAGVEDIRTVLMLYFGYEMDILVKDDDFRDLMIEDGGALLGDFMKMVGKRIC